MKRAFFVLFSIICFVFVSALSCIFFVYEASAQLVVPDGYIAEVYSSAADPYHISFDSNGYLYVGRDNIGSGGGGRDAVRITRISPDGSSSEEFGGAIADPDGVIVDKQGIINKDSQDNPLPNAVIVGGFTGTGNAPSRLTQIAPDGSNHTLYTVPYNDLKLGNPQQFVFDSAGRLLFVNDLTGTIGMIEDGVLKTLVSLGKRFLDGIAVDNQDRIFVSNFNSGNIYLVAPNGTVLNNSFVSNLTDPRGLAFDQVGSFGNKLYVVERGTGKILQIDPVTGDVSFFASGLVEPFGITFGPDGNMFVSDLGADLIWRIYPEPIVQVSLEIKPSSCPSPINVNSKGVLPAALIGTDTFDILTIDPATLMLEGIIPLRMNYQDVSSPLGTVINDDGSYTCNYSAPDGILDLTLKFDTQEVITAIEAKLGRSVLDGETLVLSISGRLYEAFGGYKVEGSDVAVMINKGK